VLIDAIDQITGTTEKIYEPHSRAVHLHSGDQRSIALADGSITIPFSSCSGRPARDTGLESERNNARPPPKACTFSTQPYPDRRSPRSSLLRSLRDLRGSPAGAITEIYVAVLSRYPTPAELQTVGTYAGPATAQPRETLVDLVWALINSDEFLYRH